MIVAILCKTGSYFASFNCKIAHFFKSAQNIRQMGRFNSKNISTLNVDNSIGKEKICDLFCDKYKKLYKSVPYDKEEMKSLCNIIDTNVVSNCVGGRCYNKHTVTIDDVLHFPVIN